MLAADEIRIDPFEPSDAAYRALAALLDRVLPDQPTCAGFLRRFDAGRDPARLFHRHVATAADGTWLGVAEYGHERDSRAPGRFELHCWVDPAWRRRGVGGMLYDHALERLAAHPVEQLASWIRENQSEAVRFLETRGFVLRHRHPRSELDLTRFDPRPFEPVIAAVERSGLVLRSLEQLLPEDPQALERLYDLHAEIGRDLPGAPDFALPPFELWVRAYRGNPDFLPRAHRVALDGDRFVGITQLWASQASDAILYSGITGVRRGYRRRGVATALKASVLAWAATLKTASVHPLVVRTENHELNPMFELNRRLGFREVTAWLQFEKRM